MGKQDNPAHLTYYDFGRTTVFACRKDPRFSWCAYVPECYDDAASDTYRLLVSVHGTLRDMSDYREVFVEFGDRHKVIILAPVFPANLYTPNDLSAYKFMDVGGVRYDEILLSMVDEVAEKYRLSNDKFAMFGFSGGGHFTHRFFYLHPERLNAISIGAPGCVTLLDDAHDFWTGTRDFEARFGKPINLAAMRKVDVQMVVGAKDTEVWEITIPPESKLWMPGIDVANTGNRQDRMNRLKQNYEDHGITVRHDVVPGVAHNARPLAGTITAFFDEAFTNGQARI